MNVFEHAPFRLEGYTFSDEAHVLYDPKQSAVPRFFEYANSIDNAFKRIDQLQTMFTELADYGIPVAHYELAVGGSSRQPMIFGAAERIDGVRFSDDFGFEELRALPAADRPPARDLSRQLANYLGGKLARRQPFLWDIYQPSAYVLQKPENQFVLVDIARKIQSNDDYKQYVKEGESLLAVLSDFAYAAMADDPEQFSRWQASLERSLGNFPRNPSVYAPMGGLALSGAAR